VRQEKARPTLLIKASVFYHLRADKQKKKQENDIV
jgi:hypothetical protein